jgi:hypothetical protein
VDVRMLQNGTLKKILGPKSKKEGRNLIVDKNA